MYLTVAVAFACIAIFALVLTVRFIRARHTFLRAVRTSLCLYVALFVPYAVLQAVTLGQFATLNNQGANSLARTSAQVSSSVAFAAFFGLGFSGKVALVQMWMHIVHIHSICSNDLPRMLHTTLRSTNKALLWMTAGTVALYLAGFTVLTSKLIISSEECTEQQSNGCFSDLQFGQPCTEIIMWTTILQYYEGIWAAVVLVAFTLLAFLFNGVVFAMLTEERSLSRIQLMLVHSHILRSLARPLLPKHWKAGNFKTQGEMDVRRVALQTLGTRLTVLSVFSFACKSASVAAAYFAKTDFAESAQLEPVVFLATIIAVQVVPSFCTLLLLGKFALNMSNTGSSALMQSLISVEGSSIALPDRVSLSHQSTDREAEILRLRAENAQLQSQNLQQQEELEALRMDMSLLTQQVGPSSN